MSEHYGRYKLQMKAEIYVKQLITLSNKSKEFFRNKSFEEKES